MSNPYERKILDVLINKYETSKSFMGKNQVNQRFKVLVSELFREYTDHSKFEVFQEVNHAIGYLKSKGFIMAKEGMGRVYEELFLNADHIDEMYRFLKRTPKRNIQTRLKAILLAYRDKNEILNKFCDEQLERLRENRSVQYFSDDCKEFEQLLLSVNEVIELKREEFIREFSIRVFKDSKIFQKIQGKVENLLYHYGDFPEKEQILASFNLVKTPTYVHYKGNGKIIVSDQEIDLSKFSGDIALSNKMLDDIGHIEVLSTKVITVENLTSFHRFHDPDFFVIYLGGFHNTVRRDFIRKLYEKNQEKEYYHFGDIDAGGFRILEHLKSKTHVPFKPYQMDVDTLLAYRNFTKKLTNNDRTNLKKLLMVEDYQKVIRFMLENNCKLEQEAVF